MRLRYGIHQEKIDNQRQISKKKKKKKKKKTDLLLIKDFSIVINNQFKSFKRHNLPEKNNTRHILINIHIRTQV